MCTNQFAGEFEVFQQSVNQSINQSIKQAISQSKYVRQSVSQSTNQPTNQPTNVFHCHHKYKSQSTAILHSSSNI